MLIPKTLQPLGELQRISRGQIGQAANPKLQQHLAPLGPDAADLAQMPFLRRNGIAGDTPAAK